MAWIEKSAGEFNIRPESELWGVCPKCHAYFSKTSWDAWRDPCPECGAPRRMGCRERIDSLVDKGTFVEIGSDITFSDPLEFSDASGAYSAKAAAISKKTGLSEAVIVGKAEICSVPLIIGVMDFAFLGGSLGSGTGERIVMAAKAAIEKHLPLVILSASGGARMHEGIISLMQMARTTAAITRLREAGVPYIAVQTDPTTGGVSASFAATGDLVIAEPRSLIGFAGRRVIENTIHQRLPDDFQTAEYLLEHGFLDAIVKREDLRSWISSVLSYFRPKQSPAKLPPHKGPTKRKAGAKTAWDAVRLAREKERPTIRDYIELAFEDFIELHGDRLYGDDKAIIGGFASIGGIKVALIGHCKGRTTEENLEANFGMANPEGYRKALRIMKLAEFFHLPVVTLVDTPGAYPGLEAEAHGQAEAIARNLATMARLKTPFVSVITGEGGSGGAIGLAAGDSVMMLENAIYSVISPEGCASILWRDSKKAPEAAEALKITADSLLELGVIDSVIAEPPGGAHTDRAATAKEVKNAIVGALRGLVNVPIEQLLEARHAKFMAMGRPKTTITATLENLP